MHFLFSKQLRDSGLPADTIVGKLKKDISFALRRGTVAQATQPLTLPSARSYVEDEELALNEAGWDRQTAPSSSFHLFTTRFDALTRFYYLMLLLSPP